MFKPGDTLIVKKIQPAPSDFLYAAEDGTDDYFNVNSGTLLVYLGAGLTRWPGTVEKAQKKHVVGQFLCKGRFYETAETSSTAEELFDLISKYLEPIGA